MLRGIVILDRYAHIKYAYLEPLADPSILAGIVRAIQQVIEYIMKDKVYRLEMEQIQLVVREITDNHSLLLIADRGDDPFFLEELGKGIASYLKNKLENVDTISEHAESWIISACIKYKNMNAIKAIVDTISSRKFKWLGKKEITTLIETILLNGKIVVAGTAKEAEQIKKFVNAIKTLVPRHSSVPQEIFYCEIDLNSHKFNSNAPGILKPRIGGMVLLGNIIELSRLSSIVHKMVENISEFAQNNKKIIPPTVLRLNVEKDILLFSVFLAKEAFFITSSDASELAKKINNAYFLSSF